MICFFLSFHALINLDTGKIIHPDSDIVLPEIPNGNGLHSATYRETTLPPINGSLSKAQVAPSISQSDTGYSSYVNGMSQKNNIPELSLESAGIKIELGKLK